MTRRLPPSNSRLATARACSIVTASITNEAVDALSLEPGMDAYAVVKASDVMVAID